MRCRPPMWPQRQSIRGAHRERLKLRKYLTDVRCFLLEGMRANRIESRPNCNEKGGIVEIISRKNSILSSLIFLSFLSLSLFSREREREWLDIHSRRTDIKYDRIRTDFFPIPKTIQELTFSGIIWKKEKEGKKASWIPCQWVNCTH